MIWRTSNRNVPGAILCAVLLVAGASALAAGCSSQDESIADAEDAPATVTKEERDQLAALGYATWTEIAPEDREKSGVVLYDAELSQKGINYYCSESSGVVNFMDMDGTILHRVSTDVSDRPEGSRCKLLEFGGDAGLVMLVENSRIVGLDFDSKLHWKKVGWFHHDIDVQEDGSVVALEMSKKYVRPAYHEKKALYDHSFWFISPKQRTTRRLWMSEVVEKEPKLLAKARHWIETLEARKKKSALPALDVFHLNSVQVLRQDVRYPGGLELRKGDLLFSSRHLDTIGVIDPEKERLRWYWGEGELEWPHHASLLPNGNILVFDNGVRRKASRILVVSPPNGTIVWKYEADPPGAFFSESRGSAQMLSNGNVLVMDSENGRAFEVTREGKKVWEFWNPELDASGKSRSTIYRMMRLEPEQAMALPFPEKIRSRLLAYQTRTPKN